MLAESIHHVSISLYILSLYSQGAKSVEEEEREKGEERSRAFRGVGFRLGDTGEPSQQIQGGSSASARESEKVGSFSQTHLY